MDSSWYEKLAKSGWLGTKAQVSSQYGSPAWSSKKEEEPVDTTGIALKNAMKKKENQNSEGGA